MKVHAYTSFSYSYLNRARVLAASLRKQHPDWVIWAVITDKEPEGVSIDWSQEDFDKMVLAEELIGEETERWLFNHDIVEACTAVKGMAMQHIMKDKTCKQVYYFDPDIAIFNPLTKVEKLLKNYSIVLTPHQTEPDSKNEKQTISDNEITSLDYGVFNLGFVAVRNDFEGKKFALWWSDRLHDWCYDRLDIGVFVDQKWCNLVPCFFDNVKVLRDPGHNVASWNLSQRTMTVDETGQAYINDALLIFYHFTKLGPVGDAMTRRYANDNIEIYELWHWYREAIEQATSANIPKRYWHYGTFDNSQIIPKTARELYREREDLKRAFPNPMATGENTFHEWLLSQTNLLNNTEDRGFTPV